MTGRPSWDFHDYEELRLASLAEFEPYIAEDDLEMSSLARRAAEVCETPIGMVSLIEADEQRIMGAWGLQVARVARCDTICAHTILQTDVLVVEDVVLDHRFHELPGVLGEPHVRFYAGAPMFDAVGLPLGTVCAVDTRPRELSFRALFSLQSLAREAMGILQSRRLAT